MGGKAGWEPGTDAEVVLYDALITGDQERYFRALADVELVLPVSADAVAGRMPMGWATWTANDHTHLLAFTSSESMRTCLAEHAGGARRMSLRELAGVWPNNDWWLAINPGLPIEGYLPAWFVTQLARGDARLPRQSAGSSSSSMPRDRLERVQALERAKAARATAPPLSREPVHAPVISAAEPLALPPPPPLPSASSSLPNSPLPKRVPTALPTRVPAGPAADTQADRPEPTGSEIARAAAAAWRADRLEKATQEEARLEAARQEEANLAPAHADAAPYEAEAQRTNAPKHAGPAPDFVPANSVEEQLFDAAESGNTDAFLSTLLLATVLIPKASGTTEGRWRPQPIDGEPHIICYTSTQHLTEPLETVPVKFIKLINDWPDPSWSFAVNPGTPVGATLPGGQLLALANWATEVGLGRDDDERDQPEAQVNGATITARVSPEVTVLQKAIAPSQVSYYLDRGYDRVTGFVQRAHEVGHFKRIAEITRALGLDWQGSPFAADADEIYLLRWSAYRPNLYRIPYGGQTEAAMRAMEGWVIERAPFRGNGFAPGETKDVIAEFKVDSARLPHGARLMRLRDGGPEEMVAVFDADGQRWLRTDGGP